MGFRTDFLGLIDISPPLNQAEYDHPGRSRGVRSGSSTRTVSICGARGSPARRGCCVRWSGSDCHGAGAEGLQLLIDRFLSPDDPAHASGNAGLTGFTSDHDTTGAIACEE